ncbi:MAG TPA: ADP-ribosylglycohydrolase family protein [Micromonosporaceae bacterium]|nr:ADP-ribosylglycohydrolase family protein [Micromonosporaceae bacterium]
MRPPHVAALDSLRGLALGDSFGEQWFFRPASEFERGFAERLSPPAPWRWTDDTAMALSLYRMLVTHGEVHQDDLAAMFAETYVTDPYRGYGAAMHDVLLTIAEGEPWSTVTAKQFDGQGSWGNGAAMRVAPLGAFFASDLDQVQEQAHRSAVVTHAHPEAAAGAIAVAVAAALAVRGASSDEVIGAVAERTPDSEVRSGLQRVANRPLSDTPQSVAAEVGCGSQVSAQDTVPYAVWCAARHLDDLVSALWTTASAGGDIDTTCAIVGGIVGGRTGLDAVPDEWIQASEALPEWTESPRG